jgi:hypothetical protein
VCLCVPVPKGLHAPSTVRVLPLVTPALLLCVCVFGDGTVPAGEIGVPPYFAMRLSFPEAVTPHNVEHLRQLVKRGAHQYPGALAVEDCSGRVISLSKLDEKVCVTVLALFSESSLRVGMRVCCCTFSCMRVNSMSETSTSLFPRMFAAAQTRPRTTYIVPAQAQGMQARPGT